MLEVEKTMIYFDNASTTKTTHEVNDVILSSLENDFYNPSSLHTPGLEVRKKIEKTRAHILELLDGSEFGLVITGSATEANNMALAQSTRGKILVGAGEHPSVLEKAKQMKAAGRDVEFIPLNSNGEVDLLAFEDMLSSDVTLVSVQMVSNETGAVNDIAKIAEMVHKKCPRAFVHSDLVQAVGKIDVSLDSLGVDFASISAHKIHGPKGIGAFAFKKSKRVLPLIVGGGQEMGLRSGTENVPQILGFEKALEFAVSDLERASKAATDINNALIAAFKKAGLVFHVNGNGSPFVLSVGFDGVRGETLMHALETDGILVSTGSACSSKKVGNHTLEAMGQTKDQILENIRISFGHDKVSDEDVKFVAEAIIKNVKSLRKEKK